jgi:glycosyltransferase involved in cell wall biosynthesis
VVSATIQFHRYIGTWQNKIARYIALNEFCKDKFVQGGIPEKLISIKPNFIDLPAQQEESRKDFLFVGRLSVEKGISVLAQAAKAAPEVQINVVGTGPEEENIKNISNIIFHGPKETKEVYNEMHRSYAIIVPSVWYENFPRTIVEAYACGTPVIASRIGALSHLIKDGITGILFKPNDPNDLAQKLQWALRNPEEIREMGKNARSYYENHLTADSNYKILTEIYEKAMHNA